MDVTSPSGKGYLLKPELAYTPLFHSEPFGADCMTREVICLGHDQFWYTAFIDYYPESVCDIYDWMEIGGVT